MKKDKNEFGKDILNDASVDNISPLSFSEKQWTFSEIVFFSCWIRNSNLSILEPVTETDRINYHSYKWTNK